MPTASLTFRRQVLLKVARFLGWDSALRYRTDLEQQEFDQQMQELCDYINQQRDKLNEVTRRRDLLSVEVGLLEDELKWMKAVMDAAGVRLSDYDYLRRRRDEQS